MNGRFVLLASVFISAAIVGNCEGAHVQKRIINGAASEYVPHVTMVEGRNQYYFTYGGGSFITLQHVLTAAHLIYNMNRWVITYGGRLTGDLPSENAAGFQHPLYDPVTFANNIGILFLDNPVSSGNFSPRHS